ncbi:MAG: MBL fold metallo-hydrolase [Phycisphaerae bacterium]
MTAPSAVDVACFTELLFAENAYVVAADNLCWIIDPSFPPSVDQIAEHIQQRNLRPVALVLTHGHADHIAGVDDVLQRWPDLPLHIATADRPMLSDPRANLSLLGGFPVAVTRSVQPIPLEPPGPIALGSTSWNILDTAGHSPGGRSLYCKSAGVCIVGDALFAESIGRTDFPGSHHETLIRNIRQHLFSLPDDTRVFSGHGPPTTIGHEKRSNPFLT